MQSQISQCSGGAICQAKESSSSVPATHSTYPPNMERLAEPDPKRAQVESSFSSNLISKAAAAAKVRAAKPEAEEASPAPVGKSLTETTRALRGFPAKVRRWSR